MTSDLATWRTPTLRAAIGGQPLAADVRVRPIERRAGVFDLVLANTGTLDARYPVLQLSGDVTAVDLVAGYPHTADTAPWLPPDRSIAAGSELGLCGFVTTRVGRS